MTALPATGAGRTPNRSASVAAVLATLSAVLVALALILAVEAGMG